MVEIGSKWGRSAWFLWLGLKCRDVIGSYELYCVDTWENTADHEKFKSLINYHGIHANSIRASSTTFFSEYTLTGGVQLLFIDAAHDTVSVVRDFRAAAPHLRPGSIVAFHDVGVPGHDLSEALRIIEDNNNIRELRQVHTLRAYEVID